VETVLKYTVPSWRWPEKRASRSTCSRRWSMLPVGVPKGLEPVFLAFQAHAAGEFESH